MSDRNTTAGACAYTIALLLLLMSTKGCIKLETAQLEIQDQKFKDLPDISLVQRVIPQRTTKEAGVYFGTWETEEVSDSKFGAPNEIANLDCVIDGILGSNPSIEIVPTEIFWSQVANFEEEVELSELFDSPALERWQEARIDFLVASYHQELDVEMFASALVLEGGYFDTDRETAAVLVIDLQNQRLVQASEAVFEDMDAYAHVLIIPYVLVTTAESDPCEAVGMRAGEAIAKVGLGSAPRVVVVAAKSNPYRAVFRSSRFEIRRLKERAESGGLEALEGLYEDAYSLNNLSMAWELYCVAAHYGHAKARYAVGNYYRYGRGPISPDLIRAYLWYSLAGDVENAIRFKNQEASAMTAEQITEAERLLVEWQPNPAECELEAHSEN